jgi:hypothetical protein
MKLLSFVVLLLAGTTAAAAQGQNSRYCFTSRDGFTNCGFATRAQCEKARRGVSVDNCRRNPRYRARR